MIKPWYKQFWPWFLIALPSTVVIWTLVVVYVFSLNSVSLVTEDYYKKGKGINIDITKVEAAKSLGLKANILSDGRDIIINFDKGSLPHYPAITALFAHRTLPDHDFNQLLTADANGSYRLNRDDELQGPWFIELTPHNSEWLIQGRVNFPSLQATQLLN
ncbi:hypothetical protein BCU68_00240 [Vibrio sp. 10N.286.49.B3]|uniref:FixH family protein n=1 Tax=Vibrio sp. 10N.286.49.B3 TaxID=1880855 RepID=UPI000C82134A|nr:FixH family protein [Vibrio sp. 10N.286.49.B3]PMH46877.1 hypothetical protein BCU68_00240 [Vibrio sp. 10N.286.49.B3]